MATSAAFAFLALLLRSVLSAVALQEYEYSMLWTDVDPATPFGPKLQVEPFEGKRYRPRVQDLVYDGA